MVQNCVKLNLICNYLVISAIVVLAEGLGLYHVGSNVTFVPDGNNATYFGYSVAFTESGMYVGAPKALNPAAKIATGLVYKCPLNFGYNTARVTCQHLPFDRRITYPIKGERMFVDDMWFGAVIVPMSKDDLLVCAPRWFRLYHNSHHLAPGVCVAYIKNHIRVFAPFLNNSKLVFAVPPAPPAPRREYGKENAKVNFYAYSQAGMSAAASGEGSVVIGAPGMLQWTGGVLMWTPSATSSTIQPIMNPYYTSALMPDDYFGYSVATGVFDSTGQVLNVAGAPRGESGRGQVLIFELPTNDTSGIRIKAALRGPQLGSYFGATLCTTDIDGDGIHDLLVGAPNYVSEGPGLPFDQGAVLVYLSRMQGDTLAMELVSTLTGSGASEAKFGTSIAQLGDVDGDGFIDIAIGAPFEDGGSGAVYIYRGSKEGLRNEAVQKIVTENSRGFGISISRGYDVDGNKCNDLAVGAHESAAAFVFRCVPTVKAEVGVSVPNTDIADNSTTFLARFCVRLHRRRWNNTSVELRAKITVDEGNGRAYLLGDDMYNVLLSPDEDQSCSQRNVQVLPTDDLSYPITIHFGVTLKNAMNDTSSIFNVSAVRLSEDSKLSQLYNIQLTRDCGDDLICNPTLVMTLDAPESALYVPGLNKVLGVRLTVLNTGEPAYGAVVFLSLPLPLKRVPEECSLSELNATCSVPVPLLRRKNVTWDFEFEFTQNDTKKTTKDIVADLRHRGESLVIRHMQLTIEPRASFEISGKALPNDNTNVTRKKLYEKGNETVIHYFQVKNEGPSDWGTLEALIKLPPNTLISTPIQGCSPTRISELVCLWSVAANETLQILLKLKVDLSPDGLFENTDKYNITSTLILLDRNQSISVMSTLVLEPKPPLWPIILGAACGLLLLGCIVYVLYKRNFFARTLPNDMRKLQDDSMDEDNPNATQPMLDTSSIDSQDI